mmetsp:Transcript_759/g.2040  ORF Transcript_759/g.2040 Transcript_759/m.2040 type:complete len:172 (-) Transcript_759:286-801(-)
MTFVVAGTVVALSLAALGQFTGLMTVRARLRSLKMASPEDDEAVRESEPPWDLRIFLACFPRVLCICGKGGCSAEVVARWEAIHRHATENNVAFGLILFGSYLAIQDAQTRGSDVDTTATEVALYAYLGFRLIHWLIYASAVRQPYRALAFIASQVCLGVMLRSAIGYLLA